jgi:hypothetical protein
MGDPFSAAQIRKGQFAIDGADAMSFIDQFYALAGQVRPV